MYQHQRPQESFDPYDDQIPEFEDEENPGMNRRRGTSRRRRRRDQAAEENPNRLYYDPSKPSSSAALDDGVHNIPGSPWAKPAVRPYSRPKETLPIAKVVATCAVILSILWITAIILFAVWNFDNLGRMIGEIVLGVTCFFGLFWSSYYTTTSIFKCLVPGRAFQTNTKYSSVIPEEKSPFDKWLTVTIQIPVFKEPIHHVILPTLESTIKARDHYIRSTGTECNIVVCDDGMMVFLKNNFAAAEMLWETIVKTKGRILKLSRLIRTVPRPSRMHLKGLQSKSVYEVFHRMLFYYHFKVGFVARSTWDRPGKAKRASNLNSHMRLVWGARQQQQQQQQQGSSSSSSAYRQALHQESHNADGSRFIMFGNDVSIGQLLVITEANSRMAEPVITKTVPEFLNDSGLGFTQHATKTLDDQRGESYFVNLISAYTDAQSQGHHLLSSILGCHPPLVGQSVFLRSEAVRQCGRVRTLRKTQQWLQNIGIPFLSVDQVGLRNLQDHSFTEYWSENHVLEDFELMIHLYNLGFDGRYVTYPDCEFEKGVSRTFDEEASKQRKLSWGAHEIMFNPLNTWLVRGPFSPVFRTMFKSKAIPSTYKIFLTSHLLSYSSGGIYLFVFSVAAVTRILDTAISEESIWFAFNSAGVLALTFVLSYMISSFMLLIALIRIRFINKDIMFTKYSKGGLCYLLWKQLRYSMLYQWMFHSCMATYYFLGCMDHLLSRDGFVSPGAYSQSKNCVVRKFTAIKNAIVFNSGSWLIGFYLLWLIYAVVLEQEDWDWNFDSIPEDWIPLTIFAGPAAIMAVLVGFIPLILNPYVVGWPFHPPLCRSRNRRRKMEQKKRQVALSSPNSQSTKSTDKSSPDVKVSSRLLQRKMRLHNNPDVESGSVATFSTNWVKSPQAKTQKIPKQKPFG
ncbi:MAG: hypothetical protein SGBAC_005806 [Bacillariaceae sp.]